MNQIEEVLGVLRKMKQKSDGPLLLSNIFKHLIDERICESSRSVSDCLKELKKMGKIRNLNSGIDIELLENVKVEYSQSSLLSLRK